MAKDPRKPIEELPELPSRVWSKLVVILGNERLLDN